MSLEGFQRAFAWCAASPGRCLALRDDPALADRFALDARERTRLLAMVHHVGMSHHCTLHRATRLAPVARSLPRTCERLGPALVYELEAFWADADEAGPPMRGEAERFAHWLLRRIGRGGLGMPALAEAVQADLQALRVPAGGVPAEPEPAAG